MALNGYIALRPKDQDALRELAGLYLTRATCGSKRRRTRRSAAAYLTAGSTSSPSR